MILWFMGRDTFGHICVVIIDQVEKKYYTHRLWLFQLYANRLSLSSEEEVLGSELVLVLVLAMALTVRIILAMRYEYKYSYVCIAFKTPDKGCV